MLIKFVQPAQIVKMPALLSSFVMDGHVSIYMQKNYYAYYNLDLKYYNKISSVIIFHWLFICCFTFIELETML